MPVTHSPIGIGVLKCSVNLTLTEGLVTTAKTYEAQQQQARVTRQQEADVAAMDWNAVHASLGSFADQPIG